ncbi:MAG TPA: hypothetical protein VGI87_04175 [Solirubrobacteraceae bacterium]|jgi:hypothetical protein
MSDVQRLFDVVGDRLTDAEPGVEWGKIMHSTGLKAPSGKFFAEALHFADGG